MDIPEWIVPVIIAVIYLFGNIFSKRGEDASEQPRRPAAPLSGSPEPDAEERQRRVQEEIRRKIMERRQATSGSAPPPMVVKEEWRRQSEEIESRPEPLRPVSVPPVPMRAEPLREVVVPEGSAVFSWDASDNVYQKNIEERLRKIEATKAQAARLSQEASLTRGTFPAARKSSDTRRKIARVGSVRETLTDPAAARTAFIFGEVMGPPVALRKGESEVPGLG